VGVRFSRHAKNKARFYKIDFAQFDALVMTAQPVGFDPRGKPIFEGVIRGQTFQVVVALDEPDLIVTIYKRRR
jgi:hypothetical protein